MLKKEIERKFLVADLPEGLENHPKKRFAQAYISVSPTIRLRDEAGEYILCVKSEGQLMREEFETKLTRTQFERLWKKSETESIVKTRYFIPIENALTAELDIYHEKLEGLLTVEVEFETEREACDFVPPGWFGADVTGDARYKNTSLALYGLPSVEA